MRTRKNSPAVPLVAKAEPFRLPDHARNIINSATEAIRQYQSAIPDWFEYYALNHGTRLGFDLLKILEYGTTKSNILEIGGAPFILSEALRTKGFGVISIDVAPERFDEMISGLSLNVHKCDIETQKLDFADNSFDIVLLNEVFEHLRIDPIFTMRELYRVLKRDGILMLSTPNGSSFSNLRNLLLFDRSQDGGVYEGFESLHTVGHMGHVREYTATDIFEFLEKIGFTGIELEYRGRYPSNLGQIAARLHRRLRPHFSIIATKVIRSGTPDQPKR